ncbi:MFS transporter [Phenylobacterium sp.]|uniref:MFS transporter n=1 Tax=Phenylobacterium sp. TaxID=1871053 RepID=UPI002DE40BC5|nr:MFS transporter [Phenylobacterium sp.]
MTAAAAAPAKPISMTRVALTSLAASSIEWYDFFIYGTAAALVFPKLFFAAGLPPAVAQLASFSTFAVGFIARPVGGILFGHFGDRLGRKRALVTAMLLMGIATTAVGLLPGYATLGVAAPVILILLRFLQGLAVGGQWGGAALIAIENAPAHRKGFFGSFAQMGVPAGVVLANFIFLVMGSIVAPDAFVAWAWRVPFLLSILLVGLAMYVQLKLEDTAEFQALQKAAEKKVQAVKKVASPILEAIAKHPKEILLAAGSFVAANGTFYIMITYAIAYATTTVHVPRTTILWAVLLGSVISAPILPLTAALSDRFGRRGVFLAGAALELIWAWPFFMLLNTGSFPLMLLAMAGGLGFNSVMYGLQAAMMTEMFSTELRYSGASLGYQIGAIFGGGFAPIISTALFAKYHTAMAISVYMAILCAVSFLSVLVLTETHKKEHRSAPAKAAA